MKCEIAHTATMIDTHAAAPTSNRRNWWLFGAICAVTLALAFWRVGQIARDHALLALADQTRIDASLDIALLRTVLDKQRALPLVLSKDRELGQALQTPRATAIDQLNRKLEVLAQGTQAAVIYLVNLDGTAIAASNWHEPDSFVGNDYNFRPYFNNAMKNGRAEYFALGNVSRRPGLYISHRVDGPDGPLGVVVVKLSFDQLEKDWNKTGRPTFVVDKQEVVLISTLETWRFMTLKTLTPQRIATIRDSLQFGDAPLQPLPLSISPAANEDTFLVDAVMPGARRQTKFLAVRSDVPTTPWDMYSLSPVKQPVKAAIREAQLMTFIVLALLATMAGILLRRRQRIAARIAEAQRRQVELEQRVAERTHDLSLARDNLEAEIHEHKKTETMLQGVQQDLVHANRLAIMGQVAAGVAHEINQPVATIRAYADNAKTFIDRQRFDSARENLSEISALTERIGTITSDLRALARKGHRPSEPVSLSQVISGALMLLRSRFAGRMDQLEISLPARDLRILGHRVRLEQVLINLFQNALEALSAQDRDGYIKVSTREHDRHVILTIADNGPGIPKQILDNLFKPFNTSKENGLGLGLVIAKEILADYGGQISVESSSQGTLFQVEFKKAE